MKKILYVAAVAAIATLGSCAGKGADATDTAAEPTTEVAEAATEAVTPAASDTKGVKELTDDNLYRPDKTVDKVTVLDFNATWCGPCKKLAPVFEAAALKYPEIEFVSVDIDKMTQTATAFDIEAVPTVIILTKDGVAKTFVGTDDLLPAEKFDEIVKNL